MKPGEWAVIKAYTSPCPTCGTNHLILNRVISAPFGTVEKMPHKWWVECADCHWCGPTKWLANRAIHAWVNAAYEHKRMKERGYRQ